MPGGDRTGPMGMGPMTGRGAGFCAGFPVPGAMNAVPGRGFRGGGGGRGGRGGRRGWRHGYYATGVPGWQRAAWGWPAFGAASAYAPTGAAPFVPSAPAPQQELDFLKRQAEGFAGTLDQINQRIAELEGRSQGVGDEQ